MRRFFAIVFIFSSFFTQASHIIGGDLSIQWLSGNFFEITLRFYRNCNDAFQCSNTMQIAIFNKSNNALSQTVILALNSNSHVPIGGPCITIPSSQLCIEECVYKASVNIANNPSGYYTVVQTAYRNVGTVNLQQPGTRGIIFYAEIPDPALHNSSAVFGNYPNAYMCKGQLNTENMSCTDVDGDSLVYSLAAPIPLSYSPSVPVPPGPYNPIPWSTGYSLSNVIGGNPPMAIDSNTGALTATPALLGLYVVVIRVEEYRNGIKIGEIRRDLEYKVVPCDLNLAPEFTLPEETSYEIVAGDSLCFTVKLDDPNSSDSVFIATSYINTPDFPVISFTPAQGIKSTQSVFCFQSSCDYIKNTPYVIPFAGQDTSCYGANTITLDVSILVTAPTEDNLDNFPNVFTPNSDNKNDVLHLSNTSTGCFKTFDLDVYDRWGNKVYESGNHTFSWDGRHYKTGKELTPGVYYYTLEASFFGNESLKKKSGTLTLLK